MENQKIIIECECGCSMLKAEVELGDVYLSIYNYGSKISWRRKIKLAWKFLTKGTVYADQIIISPEQADKLSSFIDKYLLDLDKNKNLNSSTNENTI